MSIDPGTYKFGPGNGELLVKTGREGAAAKLGKELTLEVGEWEGILEVSDDPSQTRVELSADGGSLKVHDDRGGVTTLTDLDKDGIREKIDEHVLKQTQIKFHSKGAEQGDGERHVRIDGELEILGQTAEVQFELAIGGDDADAEDEDEETDAEDSEGDGGDAAGDEDDKDDASAEGDDGDASAEGDEGDNSDTDEDEDDGDGDGDRMVRGTAIVRQSDFGIDRYSTLLGAIKTADEVEVAFSGKLKNPQ
jgi:polyisoprenoid-binding protein YceI